MDFSQIPFFDKTKVIEEERIKIEDLFNWEDLHVKPSKTTSCLLPIEEIRKNIEACGITKSEPCIIWIASKQGYYLVS